MDKVVECKAKCQLPYAITYYQAECQHEPELAMMHVSRVQVAPSKSLPGRLRHAANLCLDGIHWMSNQGIGGTIEDASTKSCTGLGRKATSQIFGCRAMNILCSNLK